MSSAPIRRCAVVAIATILLGTPVRLVHAQTAPKPPAGARGFATAQAAADALIQAASTFDEAALVALFGPDGKDLVTTEDPVRDKTYSLAFAALAHDAQKLTVNPSNASRATLQVGHD